MPRNLETRGHVLGAWPLWFLLQVKTSFVHPKKKFITFTLMRKQILQALLQTPHTKNQALPSVRTLMATFQAGSATVQAVLRQLEEEKQIYRIRGKGCFWGTTPTHFFIPAPKESVAERLEKEFEKDWEHGTYKPDKPLPLLKELADKYNVSQPLLRKFIAQKISEGIMQQVGRRYFFSHTGDLQSKIGASRKLSEIIFVTRCNSWGGFNAESERELDFLRLVYRFAGAGKYKLIPLGMHEASGKLIDRSGKTVLLSDYPNAIGAILSTLLVQKPLNLLQIFSVAQFPVAVWWEHPLNQIPKHFMDKNHWAFFNSTFGELPGIELGNYLKTQGIKKIAYFSPYHNSSWSKDRLSGLQKTGLEIEAFTDSEFASPWDYKQIARMRVAKHSVEAYARKLQKKKMSKWVSKNNINDNLKNAEWWVCVNDDVAGIFIEMAEEGFCTLPGDEYSPNIISFDNSAESYLLRIKSYDFNTEALVDQMFYYIGNPDIGKNKIHQISGNVVEK